VRIAVSVRRLVPPTSPRHKHDEHEHGVVGGMLSFVVSLSGERFQTR
jgi:hypothetical protein